MSIENIPFFLFFLFWQLDKWIIFLVIFLFQLGSEFILLITFIKTEEKSIIFGLGNVQFDTALVLLYFDIWIYGEKNNRVALLIEDVLNNFIVEYTCELKGTWKKPFRTHNFSCIFNEPTGGSGFGWPFWISAVKLTSQS